MSKQFRVGIIGAGIIGQRVGKGFAQNEHFTVVSVCDTNSALAEQIAVELGAAHWSTDYRTMLSGDLVDLVYIGVPPRFHREIALEAIAAGKQIFCEKPLAMNVAEAEEMTRAVQAAGLVNAINISLHWSNGFRHFREQLAAGYLGEFRRGELTMIFPQWPRGWQQNPWIGKREQGGAIREVTPHMFYLMLLAFGPVARVQARMEYPAHDPEASESGAYGALELASGQLITVSLLCNLPRRESVSFTAYGSEGALGLVEWTKPVGAKGEGALEPLSVPEYEWVHPLTRLAQALRGEQVELPDFATGLALQKLQEAWERAAETGEWVNV